MDHHLQLIPPSKASTSTCFPNTINASDQESAASSMEFSTTIASSADAHLNSLLCNLSLLKDKVHQAQSMATSVFPISSSSSSSAALAGMATLIQEIIVTASGMMFNCQQMAIAPPPTTGNTNNINTLPDIYGYDGHLEDNRGSGGNDHNQGQGSTNFLGSSDNEAPFYWYNETFPNSTHNGTNINTSTVSAAPIGTGKIEAENYDIIEIDAAELLAKYTHYCQVCAKGFKRDANLRMHMRAHGDEYKSSAALSNPLKNKDGDNDNGDEIRQAARKYSCPQEGCRWNRKHAKFQPLKSMVCVKNHYKRSHCPKMYMCNRCNRKQFSVLSDLRTHEKHCGDLRWRCSCGTTFSRKDKLMGHVALFVGHSPVGLPPVKVSVQ